MLFLGIILLAVIAVIFGSAARSDGSREHKDEPFFFISVGVISFGLGMFGGYKLLDLFFASTAPGYSQSSNDGLLTFMAAPFGILASAIAYIVLKKYWHKLDITPEQEKEFDDAIDQLLSKKSDDQVSKKKTDQSKDDKGTGKYLK